MPIALHVVCNNETRPELVVIIDGSGASLLGLSSAADAATVVAAEGAVRCEVSAAQYDQFVALSRQGDGN